VRRSLNLAQRHTSVHVCFYEKPRRCQGRDLRTYIMTYVTAVMLCTTYGTRDMFASHEHLSRLVLTPRKPIRTCTMLRDTVGNNGTLCDRNGQTCC
jgi:hypothetical protein